MSLGVALVGALTIVVLGIVVYHARVPAAPAEVAVAYVIAVFCFASVGVLLASLAPSARAAQSVGLLLWFVMLFVSGTSAPLGTCCLPGCCVSARRCPFTTPC